MQQIGMGPPPNQRSQPMLMSIQSPLATSHTGVLVSIPPGPAIIATSLPQQVSKNNLHQIYHYESTALPITNQRYNEPPEPSKGDVGDVLNNTVTNMKEKTPMCLVNELARYNKIQHQYQLTEETGPAHKKVFTVTLKLGNEEYKSEGPSIKKAQHLAAAQSLAKTEFKHPPSKTIRSKARCRAVNTGVMTPTVELNALAMKKGQRPVYIVETQPQQGYIGHSGCYPRPNVYGGTQQQPPQNARFSYEQRRPVRTLYPYENRMTYGQYHRPVPPHNQGEHYTVRLRVGDTEYVGSGFTVQAARHDAAAKAIDGLKKSGADAAGEPEVEAVKEITPQELNMDLKSPISLVHEIALKRNLNVSFEVTSEKGPPHMKIFVTQCQVGTLVTEGEGNGKKVSKRRAAAKMLEELTKLPPLTSAQPPSHVKRKRVTNKKKTRNLVKVNIERTNEPVEEINPISRLIQIQQANKEKEPVYTVLEERGVPRRREFVIEASIKGHSSTGIGPNKKIAKRNAADALLKELGYVTANADAANKTADKGTDGVQSASGGHARKVKFVEAKSEPTAAGTAAPIAGSAGRQLVPGVLLVADQAVKLQPIVAEENRLSSDTTKADKVVKNETNTVQSVPGIRSKDQLLYLAQLLNIQVQFSDFPKANHEMYLTLVSLSTNPPHVCHGEGPTTDASHEKAALEALKVLSVLGLDIVDSGKNSSNEICPSSQGNSARIQNGSVDK